MFFKQSWDRHLKFLFLFEGNIEDKEKLMIIPVKSQLMENNSQVIRVASKILLSRQAVQCPQHCWNNDRNSFEGKLEVTFLKHESRVSMNMN